MENWNGEKSRAAYLLSDEIFGALRNVQLADHLLNSAMDFRMDDEEVDSTDSNVLRATFKEIVWRMDIMCHYLCEVRGDLYMLDTAAREYTPDKSSSMHRPQSGEEILARAAED